MSTDLGFGLFPDGTPIGWQVTDPDGNVVQQGPPVTFELVAMTDEPEGAA